MKTQLLQGLNDGESDRDLVELVLVRLQEPNEEAVLSFQISSSECGDVAGAHDTITQHQLYDLPEDHLQLCCSRLLLDALVLCQTCELQHDLCSILSAIDDGLD